MPLAAAAIVPTRLYTVAVGDTLVTIADRFGVSLSQLRSWNGIPSGIRVDPGRRLHVAEPAPSAFFNTAPQDYWPDGTLNQQAWSGHVEQNLGANRAVPRQFGPLSGHEKCCP